MSGYAQGGILYTSPGTGTSWNLGPGPEWEAVGFIDGPIVSKASEDETLAPWAALTVPKCHCGRDWHTAPLRERVAVMLRAHYFNPEYDSATDDSPIVCVGSETYGPNRNEGYYDGGVITTYGGFDLGVKQGAPWLQSVVDEVITWTTQAAWNVIGGGSLWTLPEIEWPSVTMKTWFLDETEPEPCPEIPELDIKLGPEHWPVQPVRANFSERHKAGKAAAAVPPIEWREPVLVPESSGLDVSTLVEEFNKKHNPPKYPTKGLNT